MIHLNHYLGTWLGGLNKFDQKSGKIKSFTQKDGLKSHSVQSILGDEENDALWLSTFEGISRFDLKKESFNNFGVQDGIHANQFADGSQLKTSTGLFVFGGSNGITVFDPKEIQNNLTPPKVSITDFKIFNNSVIPGESSILKKPIYETDNIILNYNENDIELNYFAAHFVNPQKNQYAFKLENYEDDWRYVGNQRSAIYPNLPPGDYVFHLKASNNNEVWNEKGISLSINILPPWWRTIWAYIGYSLLFAMGVFVIDRLQRRRLLQKERTASAMKEAELRAVAAEAQAKVIQSENDRKSKELEEARQLQLSMLPKYLPQIPNFDIAVYMKTATEVGGDYYDFSISEDGTMNISIGDATGHGMQAGTLVTIIKGLFTSEANRRGILEFFSDVNRTIKDINMGRLIMAFSLVKLNGKNLQYSCAGMPPMYIYRKESNSIDEIDMQGMPLGSMRNFKYNLYETKLLEGDSVLLLSDGYPELMNGENEQIGYERLQNQFLEIANRTPKEMIEYFKKFGSDWVDRREPDDDVTFVVIKVR